MSNILKEIRGAKERSIWKLRGVKVMGVETSNCVLSPLTCMTTGLNSWCMNVYLEFAFHFVYY